MWAWALSRCRKGAWWAVWLVAIAAPAHAQQAIGEARIYATERIVIGGSTFGSTSPLQVVGLPSIAGTIVTVDGSGNLGTSGAATAASLGVTGAATVGTTLGVTGNTTLTGDLAINGNDLTSTGVLTVRPTGNLTLDPTGDVVIGADGSDVLPASGYAYNIGSLTTKFLTLHAAELWVQTLVAQDTLATIGGRILVAPTTELTAALGSAIGDTTITVKHNSLASGDRIYLEANGSVEFMAVTSTAGGSAGAYTYSVTRDLDGSGRNAWNAGDAVLNTGTTGEGFIDIYSTRGVKAGTEIGPTLVGNVRNSTTYNDWSPRWAAGNLNGLYGYGSDTYGFAAGNPSDTYFTIDASNGFQIYDGATKKFWLTTSGAMALYDSATTYLQLTGGAIKMVEGGTEVFNLSSGVATFGQPLTSNNTGQLQIDASSIKLRWRNNAGSTSDLLSIANSGGVGFASFSVPVAITDAQGLDVPQIVYSSGDLTIRQSSVTASIVLAVAGTGAVKPNADATRSLGASGARWGKFFLGPTTTTATFNPLVLGTSGEVWEKTDGISATFNPTTCTSMTYEGGILTAKAGC